MNPVTSLSTYVKALGVAYLYSTATPTVAGSWALLGITEGDIAVNEKFHPNDYKLPEWTGDAVHERNIDGQTVDITAPLVWGDATLYDTLAPLGAKGGGRSAPTAVVTRSVCIIPRFEVGTSLGYDGTSWTPAAPAHAIWIHRATFLPGAYSFRNADGGKVMRHLTIEAMFDDTKPEGQKLYTIGDFATQGITTYRV